jgi:hypothetical protein
MVKEQMHACILNGASNTTAVSALPMRSLKVTWGAYADTGSAACQAA